MSTAMEVRESEMGVVRLFALDLPRQEALRLGEAPDQIAGLLGVASLDVGQLEIFDVKDLAGIGLAGYLSEGHGIADSDLKPHAALLDQQSGVMVILRSAAITERPVNLLPQSPLRWIATFGEQRAKMPLTSDLDTDSAKGGIAVHATPSAARGSIWVAFVALMLTTAVALALWLGFGGRG